ncbi:MAG: gamma-glutamyl-gamma-aminobutyrate hydrolase family protein [Victivallaceae bacterium]|nr:gamma-glutamyl-gamma-aminobutyrate hydrolase family protein [Victivallaceae bacterium]
MDIEKPTIGVPKISRDPEIHQNYIAAVELAGGIPMELSDGEDIGNWIAQCDGFLFVGGPDFIGHDNTGHFSLTKGMDRFYREIGRMVIFETMKPFLGICLGCQLINLTCGGSLYGDIAMEIPGALDHEKHGKADGSHYVNATGHLTELLGSGRFQVNSAHHQSIKELGKNVVVEAQSDDGVIESIRLDIQGRFAIGVQWHPERCMIPDVDHSKLFRELVESAGTVR